MCVSTSWEVQLHMWDKFSEALCSSRGSCAKSDKLHVSTKCCWRHQVTTKKKLIFDDFLKLFYQCMQCMRAETAMNKKMYETLNFTKTVAIRSCFSLDCSYFTVYINTSPMDLNLSEKDKRLLSLILSIWGWLMIWSTADGDRWRCSTFKIWRLWLLWWCFCRKQKLYLSRQKKKLFPESLSLSAPAVFNFKLSPPVQHTPKDEREIL